MASTFMTDSPFLNAGAGRPAQHTPVWFMRQAGRSLPEYRELRGSGSILDAIALSLDQAIPCGLIINELVSNAMKYAFKGIDERELTIEITDGEDHVRILVADNGIGLPADFRYEESDSLGVQLVYTLVEQLDGTIEVDAESGTRFLITFDKPQHP